MLHKVWGFKFEGEYDHDIPKKLVVAAPHTSGWDLPLGIFIRNSLGADINYVGKASLFRPPFGWFFRWVGGVPVDRSKSNNFVDAMVDTYAVHERINVCMAPEGTRKKVEKLKTGFYYISLKAQVPYQLCALDYENKIIRWSPPIQATENMEKDMAEAEAFFRGVKGKIPEYSF